MAQRKIAIVGAGLAGATLAFELSSRGGYDITVFDKREHVAGNTHTERDPETGVMVHKYGPHIFHTDSAQVWRWFGQFTTLIPYVQRTKGLYRGNVYSLPVNLHTINQFYKRDMTPAQAEAFIAARREDRIMPTNFEEVGQSLVGPDLYNAFFKGYTMKQWGMDPALLPGAILKRLPLRFDYNDNAFFHRFQGLPREGYTAAVQNMLDVDRVTTRLGYEFRRHEAKHFHHTFYSGPIDEWFYHGLGRLPYRTLDFKVTRALGDYQGCSVMNNCDIETPWTRSTEHKHFSPWEQHEQTYVTREYPRDAAAGDIPYYPIRFAKDKAQLLKYQEMAANEAGVSFIGRLGTYQYLDMDATIAASLDLAKRFHVASI